MVWRWAKPMRWSHNLRPTAVLCLQQFIMFKCWTFENGSVQRLTGIDFDLYLATNLPPSYHQRRKTHSIPVLISAKDAKPKFSSAAELLAAKLLGLFGRCRYLLVAWLSVYTRDTSYVGCLTRCIECSLKLSLCRNNSVSSGWYNCYHAEPYFRRRELRVMCQILTLKMMLRIKTDIQNILISTEEGFPNKNIVVPTFYHVYVVKQSAILFDRKQ